MKYLILLSLFIASSCNAQSSKDIGDRYQETSAEDIVKVDKSDEEWKKELNKDQYRVIREHGTERPFTSEHLENKKQGTYVCTACKLPLFASDTKFESGTGWPSFYDEIKPGYVVEKSDNTYGMTRVEILCARCDGHLGHVFDDGPEPTGLRYCVNGVSLEFVEGE